MRHGSFLVLCVLLCGCATPVPPAREITADLITTSRLNISPDAIKRSNALLQQDDSAIPLLPGALVDAALPDPAASEWRLNISDTPQDVNYTFQAKPLSLILTQVLSEDFGLLLDYLPTFTDGVVDWQLRGSYSPREIVANLRLTLGLYGVDILVAAPDTLQLDGQVGSPQGTVRLARLQHLGALDAALLVQERVAGIAGVASAGGNSLWLAGTEAALGRAGILLAQIDVPELADKNVILYDPRYLSASALAAALSTMTDRVDLAAAAGFNDIAVELLKDEERVLILTPNAATRTRLLGLLAALDQRRQATPYAFIYRLRNVKAEEAEESLKPLLPSLGTPGRIKMSLNRASNSLLFTATPQDYAAVRSLLKRLDTPEPSVLIDATVVEVQLQNDLAYGVEWFLAGRVGNAKFDTTTNLGNPDTRFTSLQPPLELGVVSAVDNAFATINLLAGKTDLRILSRPRVLVRNRATATIKSADEIRVLKTELVTSATDDGSSLPKREFIDKQVGVTLEVTPEVGENGDVTLKVRLEDSRLGPLDNSTGEPQPTFNLREVNTQFNTANGETVVIAGLIQDTNSTKDSSVPLLGDLPILGRAFQNTSVDKNRTELLVFLSAYVAPDISSARLLSDALAGFKINKD